MGGSDGLQTPGHDFECPLGPVAITTQVTEAQPGQAFRHDLFGDIGCGIIGQMAVTAEDSLFGAPGAFEIVLQEFDVVVGLQHQNVGQSHTFRDQPGGVAEIGEEADVSA